MIRVGFAHLVPVDCSIGIRLENCCKSIKGQTDQWKGLGLRFLNAVKGIGRSSTTLNISSFNTFAAIDNQASEGFAQQILLGLFYFDLLSSCRISFQCLIE